MIESYKDKTVLQEIKEAFFGLLIPFIISLFILLIMYLLYSSLLEKHQNETKAFSANQEIEWEIVLIKADDDFFTYQIQPNQKIYFTSTHEMAKALAQYGEVVNNFTEKGKPVFIIRCINYRKTVLARQ